MNSSLKEFFFKKFHLANIKSFYINKILQNNLNAIKFSTNFKQKNFIKFQEKASTRHDE